MTRASSMSESSLFAAAAGGLAGCRSEFPALSIQVDGLPAVFLDGPGGTQVPHRVVDAMTAYLYWNNANSHGAFVTSQATDALVEQARARLAEFLGANSPDEIAFGYNTTTLNFRLARMIARDLSPGDEIVITELDHEANRAPWLALRDHGIVIREARVDTATCQLDMSDLAAKIGPRTKAVAVGAASNAVGTINDLASIRELTRAAGALLVVDAVHYVPHVPTDVQAIGCDFLLCSAYKFFGPHLGVLYGRRAAFERLRCYKVEPQLDTVPHRIETGTPNFAAIAGAAAAVDFIASLDVGRQSTGRAAVRPAMQAIEAYEAPLAGQLRASLAEIPGLTLYGSPAGSHRTPTVSFAIDGHHAAAVAAGLGAAGIFAWDGDFYATTLVRRLGLAERGGLLRLGLAPYNTLAEIERTIAAVARIALG